MSKLVWVQEAKETFQKLEADALATRKKRTAKKQGKSSKQEGLFKQVYKTIQFLEQNPRHPGLQTHEYRSLQHPYDKTKKVFEAYAQNKTPGAYRVFWCYGPKPQQVTIIAITPHP